MKLRHIVVLTTFLAFFTVPSKEQISSGGVPLSLQDPSALKFQVPVEVMPAVDVLKLRAEDSVNDNEIAVPWRFGAVIPLSMDMKNAGVWEILPDGNRIWRLGIQSKGALTINLTFDRFFMPHGATFFEYTPDRKQVIGAFTDFNNRADSVFATTLLRGDEIILEYDEPAECPVHGVIRLKGVTHGYRDSFLYMQNRYFDNSHMPDRDFGDSQWCNNNVHCLEAADWQDQVRSVVLTMVGGSYWCSGALVNNTYQDGTPYILTAEHCYTDPSTWVFWFNWESPTCENPLSPPGYNSISGASLVAKSGYSDFCLLKLSSVPPASYNVYYAGWNRSTVPATSGAGIHHPMGDIKKISYTGLPFIDSTVFLWEVLWQDGITESGSSGAPIFDQHRLIVAGEHGGYHNCNSSRKWVLNGKFCVSWDYGSTPDKRLKEWLDPLGTNPDTLHGWDPNTISLTGLIIPTVNIFPNPGTGKFRIVLENNNISGMEIRIMDLQGRIIHYQIVDNKNEGEFDLSWAGAGVYFAAIRTARDNIIKKLIINR